MRAGLPSLKARTIAQESAALAATMMTTVVASASGASMKTSGLSSMPTETKNSTAKASRSGSASSVACWLSVLSPMTTPAKKAPSANETSNSLAAPNATPIARA